MDPKIFINIVLLDILIIFLFIFLIIKEFKIQELTKLLQDQNDLKKDLKVLVENIDLLKEQKKTLKDVFFFR